MTFVESEIIRIANEAIEICNGPLFSGDVAQLKTLLTEIVDTTLYSDEIINGLYFDAQLSALENQSYEG